MSSGFEALNPPVEGDVINADASFGEEFFEITIGKVVAEYQRTVTMITSGGKRKPANADKPTRWTRQPRRSFITTALPTTDGWT